MVVTKSSRVEGAWDTIRFTLLILQLQPLGHSWVQCSPWGHTAGSKGAGITSHSGRK
jgi:hypothetical protein